MKNVPSDKNVSELSDYCEILPSLLSLIITSIHPKINEELFKLTMRCFNQREEFINNTKKVLPIIGPHNSKIYKQMTDNVQKLSAISAKINFWFQDRNSYHSATHCLGVLKMVKEAFYSKIDEELCQSVPHIENADETELIEINKTVQEIF